MEKCPICKSNDVFIIHHFYSKDLHKAHKVYKCRTCSHEWTNK